MIRLTLCLLCLGAEDPVLYQRYAPHLLPDPLSDETNRYESQASHFGQWLFFETAFSPNGAVACVTCHLPEKGFADGLNLSVGMQKVSRHTPGLLNVVYNRWFFWDGRRDSLWSQALGPFEEPKEIGTNRLAMLHLIARDTAMREAYEALFGELPPLHETARFPAAAMPLPKQPKHFLNQAWLTMSESDRDLVNRAFANLGKAIAAYERQLISKDSPFDAYVSALKTGADDHGFSEQQQRGLALFTGKAKCRLCHAGPNFTDGEFHNTGIPPLEGGTPRDSGRYEGIPQLLADPFRADGPYSDAPQGKAGKRLGFLQRQGDQWGQFKTPGLRDVARTAPYMHQGQLASLEEVVSFYNTLEQQIRLGHHQDPLLMPLGLSSAEQADLVAFLKGLNGQSLPSHLLVKPTSPMAP